MIELSNKEIGVLHLALTQYITETIKGVESWGSETVRDLVGDGTTANMFNISTENLEIASGVYAKLMDAYNEPSVIEVDAEPIEN